MKSLYVLKVGTTFPATSERYGDFDRWTLEALATTRLEAQVLDLELNDSGRITLFAGGASAGKVFDLSPLARRQGQASAAAGRHGGLRVRRTAGGAPALAQAGVFARGLGDQDAGGERVLGGYRRGDNHARRA